MTETFVNFYGGSPLNRLSWLRSSEGFLNTVIVSPKTRWILFNGGQPLLASSRSAPQRTLAHLTTNDVRPLLGSEPFFQQTPTEGEVAVIQAGVSHSPLEAARHRGTPIVFLGLQELDTTSAMAFTEGDFADPKVGVEKIQGVPFFSMDVSEMPPKTVDQVLNNSELGKAGNALAWIDARSATLGLDAFSAGVIAEARSMVDWNLRNKFCPACGSPSYSMWAGWKLSCSSLLPWADNSNRKSCPTASGLHNFTHPRTDPVVIMIALDPKVDKILLGKNKKFPGNFYSALAGFIEPGESFEDAVKREMWEEAGVKAWNVKYHSGQPWPYPANLMVGFYSFADSTQPVRLDLDTELSDARWFTREEVLAVLNHPTGTNYGPAFAGRQRRGSDEPAFRVPPKTAIAGVLISDWANGRNGTPAPPTAAVKILKAKL